MSEIYPERRARASRDGKCFCGEPFRSSVYLHYRRPRQRCEPEATDPWYVHGSWPAPTCGSAGCEAEAYAELVALHPDAVDIAVETEPGAGFYVIGDADD